MRDYRNGGGICYVCKLSKTQTMLLKLKDFSEDKAETVAILEIAHSHANKRKKIRN